MRKTIRTLVAILLLGVPSAAAAPDPCAAPDQPSGLLCGLTTISGSVTAGMQVELPQDVVVAGTVAPGGEIDIQIPSSYAAFVGVALVQDNPTRTGPGFVAGLASTSATGTVFVPTGGSACPCTLPAGGYRLYLFTDRPLTVQLRLAGLSGGTTLSPSSPATQQAGQLTRRIQFGHNLIASLNGDAFDLASPGFLLVLMRVGDVVGGDFGVCWWNGDPPQGYVPGCMNGAGTQFTGFWGPPFLEDHYFAQAAFVPAGHYSMQAWFETGMLTSASMEGVWISFD